MPMKRAEKPIQLENVELVPDATERVEAAIKYVRQPIAPKGARRVAPLKPKPRRASRRP